MVDTITHSFTQAGQSDRTDTIDVARVLTFSQAS